MAELRVKSTGTIKLFENDNTSSVTIASPASLGADRTITLPDASVTLASGTMLATDGDGSGLSGVGKILQVVSTTKSDTFTTSSTSMVDITGLTVDITPAATSSKILVLGAVNGSQDVAANRTYLRLMRDSTAIFVGDAASTRLRGSGGFSAMDYSIASSTVTGIYVDSPSTTSAVTYKWQVNAAVGGGDAYINRTEHDGDETYQIRMASTITVIEIGA